MTSCNCPSVVFCDKLFIGVNYNELWKIENKLDKYLKDNNISMSSLSRNCELRYDIISY